MVKSERLNAPAPKKFSQWPAFKALAWYSFVAQVRNPATFLFGFAFPIIFIVIFGLIGNNVSQIKLGIPVDRPSAAAAETSPFFGQLKKVSVITLQSDTEANLEQQLKAGKISGILQFTPSADQEGGTINLITSAAKPQDAAIAQSFLQNIVAQANLNISGIAKPPLTLTQQEVSGRQFRYIDTAIPGMIGFALLSTAIFGTTFGLMFLKKTLVLKRIFATPTRALTILAGQAGSRLFIAILQACAILVIGVIFFQFHLTNGAITFIEMIILAAFGLVAFLGFGLFIAGIARDENGANAMANLITLPQFLLSGTFFSTDSFPSWVQPIANNLPLSYLNIAMNKVASEGASLFDVGWYLLGIAAWSIIAYLLAARTFRWT